jgi:multidrug resistance efflux pump
LEIKEQVISANKYLFDHDLAASQQQVKELEQQVTYLEAASDKWKSLLAELFDSSLSNIVSRETHDRWWAAYEAAEAALSEKPCEGAVL